MNDARRKPYHLVPLFVMACLLHGLSEWCYNAASWLYGKCGTNIFAASTTWEPVEKDGDCQ